MSDEDEKTTMGFGGAEDASRATGMLSHEDEARGYIEDFLEEEFLDDLAAVLQGAEQMTQKAWVVEITSDGTEIRAIDSSDDSDEQE